MNRFRELLPPVTLAACIGFLALTAVLFVLNSLGSPFPWANHDVSFLNYVGTDLLSGSRLYVDVLETNPPGSHFLHALVVGISKLAGIPDLLGYHLMFLLAAGAGLAVLWSSASDREGRLGLAALAAAYVLVVIRGNFSNNILPSSPEFPYDFGQREHLFAVLFVPYLAWRLHDSPFRRRLVPYLVALGFVAAFKPYWPLMPAAVEAFAWMRRKGPRLPVTLSLLVGMGLPYAVLILHSRDSFHALFSELVPLILGGGYTRYGMDAAAFLGSAYNARMISAAVLFLVLAAGCFLVKAPSRSRVLVLAAVTSIAYAGFLWQAKFWSYHGMVFFGAVATACVLLASALIRHSGGRRVRTAAAAVLVAVLLALDLSSLLQLRSMLVRYPPKGHELVPLLEGHDRVMFFSTGADYAYAPLVLGVRSAGPWREHYRLPVLLSVEDENERAAGLRDYAARIRETVERERPELLLFAPLTEALPRGVHIHDVLLEYGAVPDDAYVRIPDGWLRSVNPLLYGWIVYRRLGEETGADMS